MQNTSLGSLDVSGLLEDQADEPVNGFDTFAQEIQDTEAGEVAAAARWARKYDPQSYARAAELNPDVPPEIGIRHLELLEDNARMGEYRRVLENAPALRGYFAERPKDLAYANPDELDKYTGLSWASKAFPAAVAQGWESMQGQYAGFAVLEGTATPEQAAAFEAYRQAEGRSFGARDGWFSQGLVGLGQTLPAMGAMTLGGAGKALQYGVIGGLSGGLVGGPAGVVTGFGLGSRVGGPVGAWQQSFQMQSGAAFAEFLDFKDETGQPLDPQVARWAALLAGAGGAGLETLSAAGTLGQVPGLDRVFGQFTVPGLKALLSNPTTRGAFTRLAANLGSAVTIETLTEIGQEALTIFSGEMAKYASEGEFTPITGGEVAQRIGDAGISALQVMSILGPITSGTRFGADLLELQRSKRDNEQFQKIMETLDGDPIIARSPEIAKQLLDRQLDSKELYIDAQEARRLFQEQGMDLYGPALPNWRDRVDTALASGGDIVVTVGEYASYLSRNPKENPLAAIVRTNPEGYSIAETQALAEAQAMIMSSELARAEATAGEAPTTRATAQPVEMFPEIEQLKAQIQRIGFKPQAVEHLTTLFNSFYTAMASRTGKSPSELFQEHAVEIQRSLFTIGEGLSPDANTLFQSFYRGMSLEEFESLTNGTYAFQPDQFGMFIARRAADSRYYTQIPGSGLAELSIDDNLRILERDSKEYEQLAKEFMPEKKYARQAASIYPESFRTFLLERGYQAVRGKSAAIGHEELLLLDPALIKGVTSADLGGPTPANIDAFSMLFQGEDTPRGAITFNDANAVIQLFDGHDMSTLLHEAGHFFLQTFRDLKSSSPELQADWDIIAKHLKIEGDNITREQHEKFARMTEAYFMEGKAPSPELRPMFEAFRSWLKTLYRRITALGGRVSPEVRGVFDRMLVVEQRLDEIAADTAYAPLFESAEAMGVTMEEYLDYQRLVEDLRTEAQDSARARIAGQLERFGKGWRKQVLADLTRQAEEKLRNQAPYRQLQQLADKKLRIDAAAMADRTSEAIRKKFPRGTFVTNGLDPEIAAEFLGYPTLDEFLLDVQQAPPIKEAAKELAQQEMARRFETDFSQREIMDLAIKQQMNAEGRTTILAKELKALSSRAGRSISEAGPKQLANQIAKDSLYRRKVGDVNETHLNAAVRRAGTQAQSAIVKGDWAAAADAKRRQLLAQSLANEGAALSARIQQIRNKAARYSRKAADSIHPSYMEQIRSLVEQYEFANVSGKKLRKRQSLREFITQQELEDPGQGFLEIPDRLLRETERINYKELTVEDLIDLGDTLDNLEHLGRLKQQLRVAQGKREWAELKGEFLTSLREQKSRVWEKTRPTSEQEGTALNLLSTYMYGTVKPERLVEWLDVGNIAGPFSQNVFETVAQAEVARNDLNAKFNTKIIEIFNEVSPKYFQETKRITSLNETLTRENIYAIALNVGNESNRKKLLEGELWTETQLGEVLSHMTKEDWDRVQKIWDTLDELWGRIEKLEKRLTGVAPPRIEAREVTTAYGSYRGGYYPVVYDFKARRGMALLEDVTPKDRELSVDDIFQPMRHMTPGTFHKHTVKRTKAAKPISRELAVLPKHIHRVVHDLTHREAIRSVYKILWDPDIKNEIIRIEGEHAYRQLQHWLRAVATEYAPETDPIAAGLAKLRSGMTLYAMGYRMTTAAAQVLGLFNVVKRVGLRPLAGAAIQTMRHPVQTIQMVNDLSGEMRHRFNQQDFNLREAANRITVGQSKLDTIRHYAFYHIAFMDKIVSSTAWIGAYSEYIDKHGDEKKARQHADRTVRLTQGTGNMKDAARVVTSSEYSRLFTMFYSAFSAIHNEIWDLTRQTKGDITESNYHSLLTKRLMQWTMVVAVPAILGPLMSGQGPEEDENKLWWASKQVMLYPTVGLPVIRDLASHLESGYDYKFSPVQKVFENTARGWNSLYEGDLTAAIRPMADALSVYFRLPTGQFLNTTQAIIEGEAEGDFEPQDLIYGRRGK